MHVSIKSITWYGATTFITSRTFHAVLTTGIISALKNVCTTCIGVSFKRVSFITHARCHIVDNTTNCIGSANVAACTFSNGCTFLPVCCVESEPLLTGAPVASQCISTQLTAGMLTFTLVDIYTLVESVL